MVTGLGVCAIVNSPHARAIRGMIPPIVLAVDGWRVFWVLLLTALVEAAQDAWERHLVRLSPAELQYKAQHLDIMRQLRKLDPVSDFVTVSKLQRESVRLERQLEDAAAARSPSPRAAMAARAARPAVLGALLWLWWGQPLVQFVPSRVWPIGKMLAVPNLEVGSLGVVAWHVVCRRAIGTLVFGK